MLTILEYRIPLDKYPNPATITMPWGARILHVAAHDDIITPFLWALVDTDEKPVERYFVVIGTGDSCDVVAHKAHDPAPMAPSNYRGSAQCGPYVWHVFELRP